MAAHSAATAILRRYGVTQADLAAKLGTTQQAVSFYLAGKRALPARFRSTLEAETSKHKARQIIEAIPR